MEPDLGPSVSSFLSPLASRRTAGAARVWSNVDVDSRTEIPHQRNTEAFLGTFEFRQQRGQVDGDRVHACAQEISVPRQAVVEAWRRAGNGRRMMLRACP
jgi:hypothetical protein